MYMDLKKQNKTTRTTKSYEAILVSNKIDFKPKLIRREMEEHYILIKRKIHQIYIGILNIYTPNTRVSELKKM